MRLIISLLSLATVLAQTGSSSATHESEFLRLERLWNQAHRTGDAQVLGRLWADELVVTVPGMPVMGKPQVLGVWRSGRMKFRRYQTSNIRVHRFGGTVVVTGRLLRSRTVAGHDLEEDWRFTKVYLRRAGTWQVIAWHASAAANP